MTARKTQDFIAAVPTSALPPEPVPTCVSMLGVHSTVPTMEKDPALAFFPVRP